MVFTRTVHKNHKVPHMWFDLATDEDRGISHLLDHIFPHLYTFIFFLKGLAARLCETLLLLSYTDSQEAALDCGQLMFQSPICQVLAHSVWQTLIM